MTGIEDVAEVSLDSVAKHVEVLPLTKNEVKELAKGNIIFKGNLAVFDKTKHVWQTMSRENLAVNPSMTDKEFEAQCYLTMKCMHGEYSEAMREDFHECEDTNDEFYNSYKGKLGEVESK